MKNHFLLCAVLLAVAAFNAPAARADNWYLGGGVGVADIDGLCQGASDRFCDDQGGAARLFGGWRVNRWFAIEAALDVGTNFTTPGARAAGLDGSTTTSSLGINFIGFIPLGSRVSLFGGVSGAFSEASTKVYDYRERRSSQDCDWEYDWFDDDWDYYCRNRSSSYDDEYESDGSVALGGLAGVEVQLNKRFSLRAQAQRFFNVDGGLAFGERRDLDFVSINALFSFK